VRKIVPYLDFEQTRFPIFGGLYHKRGGTARHDAVAWGFARGADQRGVDLIQNCEVTGIDIEGPRDRRADLARCDPGQEGRHRRRGPLQPGGGDGGHAPADRKPCPAGLRHRGAEARHRHVITYGMGHFYISQSDKGGLVFGGDLDFYASYAARGNLPMAEHVVEAGMTLMPMIGKAKMLRSWGGIMDMSPDGSPIIDKTHIEGLYLNCGWCYGGFKAVPGSGNFHFAHLIATDRPHEAATRYRLDRFATGRGLMDEEGTGSQHNLH
jgi:glycine/D-amino acid oxidase-like deaminating enzyme